MKTWPGHDPSALEEAAPDEPFCPSSEARDTAGAWKKPSPSPSLGAGVGKPLEGITLVLDLEGKWRVSQGQDGGQAF